MAFAISYLGTIPIQSGSAKKDPAVTSSSSFARFWKALRRLLNQNHPKPDASLSLLFSFLPGPRAGDLLCFAYLLIALHFTW